MRLRHLAVSLLLGAVAARADQTVNVGPGIAFSPSSVTIAPGEKITWVWLGAPHSSTSNATSGPEFWDSGILSTGVTFSHTFTTPGTYPYYCQVHSSPTGTAMNGVIQVVAPTATPTPVPTPIPTPGVPPGPTAIPLLSLESRAVLALLLAAAGALLVLSTRGR